jgi:T-complex protein 1 subunit delta
VANAVRTSLGPRGMDKMVQLEDGQTLISNDGATLLSKMKVLHPAAKMLVELSQSQDVNAGDGTTTVVVLAGALLEAAAGLLEKALHPTIIATSFLHAADVACTQFLPSISRPVTLQDRDALLSAVTTCLSSKVVSQNSELLSPIAVDSVLTLLAGGGGGGGGATTPGQEVNTPEQDVNNVDLRDIRIVEQVGGTVDDSELVQGLVLTKGVAKSGSGGPTRIESAKVALLQYCLSAPKTDMDNSVVVSDYAAMDRILKQERKYLLGLAKDIQRAGANVVLIQKSILRDAYNELSLHFLAKFGILVVTDIERSDVEFICQTLGCQPIAHPSQLSPEKFGQASLVQEIWMEGGGNRVVKFTGIPSAAAADRAVRRPTVTILLRGSNEFVLSEASRSLHDALCVVRSIVRERFLVAGGGAAETYASYRLREYAATLAGKDAYCVAAFADALEVIPYTLAENAGMKPIEVVTELRAKHAAGMKGAGINVKKGVVSDMYELDVVQPLLVSTSAIRLATETVAMIMKIDDLIVIG